MLVVDIGGGSTELVVGRDEPERLVSLDVGCVRMLEKHLESDPPARRARGPPGRGHGALDEVKGELGVPAGARVIGVAGSVTQLAALKSGAPAYDPDMTHHSVLSHGDVRRLARPPRVADYEQRRRTRGLEPGRADVIVAGAEILLCVMEAFDAAEVLVSEKDILDGLVIQLLAG